MLRKTPTGPTEMFRIEFRADACAAGRRLDSVLGEQPRIGSRSRAGRLIESGAVLVDGVRRPKRHILREGETIVVEAQAPALADAEQPAVAFDIVYEDGALLVVDKPPGLVVHPAPGNPVGTLSQALAGRVGGGDPRRPGIVHRLDKDTSGLLVVAKNDSALRALQDQLATRRVHREYVALVRGRPETRAGTIDAPLGRDHRAPARMTVRADSNRNAVTHFRVIEELPGHTLLSVRLETGRTHQIRAHLAAIGLPVSGDREYGVAGEFGLERQFLHAVRLRFTHPVDERELSFESPLPPDLRTALEAARRLGG